MIESTDEALERTRELVEHVKSQNEPRLHASVSFRGLSNSSDRLIVGCKAIADEAGCLLQTHACFNYSTHDDCLANFGAPEIERLESLGVLDENMLLAHSGWLEPKELEIVLRRRPKIVSAPSSSLHNGTVLGGVRDVLSVRLLDLLESPPATTTLPLSILNWRDYGIPLRTIRGRLNTRRIPAA